MVVAGASTEGACAFAMKAHPARGLYPRLNTCFTGFAITNRKQPVTDAIYFMLVQLSTTRGAVTCSTVNICAKRHKTKFALKNKNRTEISSNHNVGKLYLFVLEISSLSSFRKDSGRNHVLDTVLSQNAGFDLKFWLSLGLRDYDASVRDPE